MPRLIIVCLALLLSAASFADDKKQESLDAQCETARQEKLKPLREQYIEECVEKEQRPDRAACERFYADYGNQSGNRAPLFNDLPECVKAFEHRQSNQ